MVGVSTERPWEDTTRPAFHDVPDVRRGELRLAAEVTLEVMAGRCVPEEIVVKAEKILLRIA